MSVAIVQARFGSTRLPGKVLADIGGRSLLGWVVERARLATSVDEVIVATSTGTENDAVAGEAQRLGASVFRGSEADVLDRFVEAATARRADVLVRLTADNPFVAPAVIDEVTALQRATSADYAYIENYPVGVGAVEALSLAAIRRARDETDPTQTYYREHVMTYLVDHPARFRLVIQPAAPPLARPELRFTVDLPDDLERARRVAAHFAPRIDFSVAELVAYADLHAARA